MLAKTWKKKNPHTHCMVVQLMEPLWKSVGEVSKKKKKTKIEPPYDPDLAHLGMLQSYCVCYHRDTSDALFTIARKWNQPKQPLTDEWVKKT